MSLTCQTMIQFHCPINRTPRIRRAKFVHAIKYRAIRIFAYIEFLHLATEMLQVIWANLLQKIDIIFAVEALHLVVTAELGLVNLHLAV